MIYPHKRYRRITDIPIESLLADNIAALILDVDNTLTTHDNPHPGDGVMEWLANVKDAGISMMILSNNSAERVIPFAQMLSLPYESDAKKPLTGGYRRACERMGVSANQTAVIGDQLFTDILGGRLFGAHCILVDLIEPEHTKFFQFKRACEQRLLARYKGGYHG